MPDKRLYQSIGADPSITTDRELELIRYALDKSAIVAVTVGSGSGALGGREGLEGGVTGAFSATAGSPPVMRSSMSMVNAAARCSIDIYRTLAALGSRMRWPSRRT